MKNLRECPECRGRGQVGNEIPGEPCERCHGKGYIPKCRHPYIVMNECQDCGEDV